MIRKFAALLAALFLVCIGASQATAADEKNRLQPECRYMPEDLEGYAFSYYCPGKGDNKNPFHEDWNSDIFYNRTASEYVNLSAGKQQPCEDSDSKDSCLEKYKWTGIGAWMSGQGNQPGLINKDGGGNIRLLTDIENPCKALKGLKEEPLCMDPTADKANPCEALTFPDNDATKDGREGCHKAHPWFTWDPEKQGPQKLECEKPERADDEDCQPIIVTGQDGFRYPVKAEAPYKEFVGTEMTVVLVCCAFGCVVACVVGIRRYRDGDALAGVFEGLWIRMIVAVAAVGGPSVVWLALK